MAIKRDKILKSAEKLVQKGKLDQAKRAAKQFVLELDMEYLYTDGEFWYFMEPDTFEQHQADAKQFPGRTDSAEPQAVPDPGQGRLQQEQQAGQGTFLRQAELLRLARIMPGAPGSGQELCRLSGPLAWKANRHGRQSDETNLNIHDDTKNYHL